MRLSLIALASVAVAATAVVAAPSARAQEAAGGDPAMTQPGTMQSGMAGGSYTRSMMVSKNDTTGANSIAAIAMSDPQFSTLVRLAKIAGLDNSLMYRGPLTVFAPTNDAFDKLPKPPLAALEMPENIKYLQAVLQYHLVPGGYTAADVTTLSSQTPATVSTTSRLNPLTISAGPSIMYGTSSTNSGMSGSMPAGSTMSGDMNKDGMSMMTGTARIVRPDIMASNGIIHVIDTVLLPPMDSMVTKDLIKSGKMSMMGMMSRKMDKPLVKEAMDANKSTPQQLKDKPLGGSPTETPKAEAPKEEPKP